MLAYLRFDKSGAGAPSKIVPRSCGTSSGGKRLIEQPFCPRSANSGGVEKSVAGKPQENLRPNLT
jgi:hypothetical protein